MRLIEVGICIYNGQNNAVSGADCGCSPTKTSTPTRSTRRTASTPPTKNLCAMPRAWIRISRTHIARRFYARWRAPRTVTISASPSYPMDAVLSRFADNLHNLNQRRENDANRQRQSRARKKAGKTGHVTKRRRTSGGGDPDTTPPEATNSGDHVTNSVTHAANCHADSHVTPSLGRHVTASERRRDYIEDYHVFILL